MAEVATSLPPSVTTTLNVTAPLRLAAGVKVQLPLPWSVSVPSFGLTLTLFTLGELPMMSLVLANSCAALKV
ncbi:hypothetical protein D3C86_2238060 [compost metagenome]